VTIATAGHPPALVRRAGGLIETHSRPGPIVGVFPTAEFVETGLVLAPGDLLIVHTDGLTDARLADGNRIGEARIHELLASLQTPSPTAAISALEALLDLSQITDDVAIVAVAPS
jgi:sigma-B regulation protein RsbU (phosphoserine phosphatase)